MIIVALLVKPIIWLTVFWSTRGDSLKDMLIWASGAAVILTVVDRLSVASNLPTFTIALTMVLYVLMSLTLIPLAWIMKNKQFSRVLNVIGVIGSFAGVNFTMDCIRTFFPLMNR